MEACVTRIWLLEILDSSVKCVWMLVVVVRSKLCIELQILQPTIAPGIPKIVKSANTTRHVRRQARLELFERFSDALLKALETAQVTTRTLLFPRMPGFGSSGTSQPHLQLRY